MNYLQHDAEVSMREGEAAQLAYLKDKYKNSTPRYPTPYGQSYSQAYSQASPTVPAKVTQSRAVPALAANLQKQIAERGSRPKNGIFGRLSKGQYSAEQKEFIDNVASLDPNTVTGDDYDNIFHEGRALFPEGGGFPRLERFLHTGANKQGKLLAFAPASQNQKGGKRRRRQTRRKQSRRARRTVRR